MNDRRTHQCGKQLDNNDIERHDLAICRGRTLDQTVK